MTQGFLLASIWPSCTRCESEIEATTETQKAPL